MIIISHNRIIVLSNIIAIREYRGGIKSFQGNTDIKLVDNKAIILTIKYDDFKEQLKNAGKANIRVLELDY
jgi:competence transcription factor ComK